MIFSNCDISHQATECLCNLLQKHPEMSSANQAIALVSGIVDFFSDQKELDDLNAFLTDKFTVVAETDRREYGDFQTNTELANRVAFHLTTKNISPEIVIEPTCGKGNFILASLKQFTDIKKVFGVEIYKPYVWESKFNIIDFYLNNPTENKP